MIRALRICVTRLGPGHPTTQTIQQSLAAVQQRLTNTSSQPPSDPAAALAPLLAAVAAIAAGNEAPRPAVKHALAQLEQQGWMLRGPMERIWAGERNRDALVAGLDDQDTALIERVLALISAQGPPPAS